MKVVATLSLRNRALIALVTIVAAVFGSVAFTGLRQELIPSIEFPRLAIVATYPGASPQIVNDAVTAPIEEAVQGIASLESTTATSSSGQSVVSVSFAYGTNLPSAEQRVSSAINRIRAVLPSGVDPQVTSGSIDDLPILSIAVTSGQDPQVLAAELTDRVLPELERIDGVRAASLVGAREARVSITADDTALAAAGTTSAAIGATLEQAGVLVPAGTITERGLTFDVQTGGLLGSLDDIRALPLAGAGPGGDGDVPNIDDVADVEETVAPSTSVSLVDGRESLAISVTKLPDANTVEVSNAVADALPELTDSLGGDAAFTTVFDQAPFIEQSIETLAVEGGLGLAFAVIVILVFLMSVRATIVSAISIPTSILLTFIGLQAADYSLNILTLGAITIAIGRVVDDAIVVTENIMRHLQEAGPGLTRQEAPSERVALVGRATAEVATAITASTLTSAAVFLPIAFVGDATGELFRPFALTTTIALVASLCVALTIVPVLAYWFLRSPKSEARHGPKEAGARLQAAYRPVLTATLRRPAVTIGLSALLLAGTVPVALLLPTNFLGSTGQNTLTVTQTVPDGTSLESQTTQATRVDERLRGIDGIETVQASIGSGAGFGAAFGGGGSASTTITYSITTDEDADQDALQATVRDELNDAGDSGGFEVAASAGFGGSSAISVEVTAGSESDLQTATDAVLAALRDEPTIAEATSSLTSTTPFVQVRVDRAAAASAGLTEAQLGGIVSQTTQPTSIGAIDLGDRDVSIFLTPSDPPQTVEELRGLEIATPTGLVVLDDLAEIEEVTGPAAITTARGVRTATVDATPAGDDLGAASRSVQAAIDATDLPPGVATTLGGATADQEDAFQQLGLALVVAILIVYVIMVATFKSLLQPLLLLVSVPFAATGAVLMQLATGIPLGVPSLIGLLMLIGIVVTNAIVLIDLVNQYRERGLSVREAVLQGAARRFRPILMTAVATMLALAPMASGLTGQGGFISQPLAVIVIGGLLSSTVLTLVVLPTLYYLVLGRRERRAEKSGVQEAAQPV